MESLNLNTLASSLPTAQQNAEKELLNDFKAAALSITKLYRSSRKTSKRAYNAGYGAACQDLLNFIQQGVSTSDVGTALAGTSQTVDGGGMTIGRVMDWTEARLEAIRATEEEEDEDEEREKDREKGRAAPQPTAARNSAAGGAAPTPPKTTSRKSAPPRPKDVTPINPSRQPCEQSHPSIPLPPSSTFSISSKPLRSRTAPSNSAIHLEPFPAVATPNASIPFSQDTPFVIGAGVKRRHAMMMMLDSGPSSISIAPGGGPSSVISSAGAVTTSTMGAPSGVVRRRTRSARNPGQHQVQNQNINVIQIASEAMDVEEEGRERKRIARR